jgi:tetratricopeptide (TPR) repeat protein
VNRRVVRLSVAIVVVTAMAAAYHYLWGRQPSPDEQLRAGRAAAKAGDADAAYKIARSLEEKYPDHARIIRAEIQLHKGNPKDALEYLNRVQDQGELRREAVAVAGQCLLHLQNLPEAERAFRFVLSEQPDHVDGHRGLAAVYYDQGALLKCLYHLGEVARLDPGDGRPHRMMGLIHADLDRPSEAVACYREALRRGISGRAATEAREELAEQLLKLGQPAAALESLGPVSETESPRATAFRAEAEWTLGRGSDATARLDAALPKHPDSLLLLRLRGQLHAEAGLWEQAAAIFERAIKVDGADLKSLHQLSVAYDRLKRTADAEAMRRRHEFVKKDLLALTDLNREADAKPWDSAVRLKLAEVCDRLGKTQLAAMWRRAAAAGSVQTNAGPGLQSAPGLP